jgi:hypothetical protein
MGIITAYPFTLGTVAAIRLKRKLSGKFGLLAGKVCQCTRRREGTWLIGYSLSRGLTEEEINSLLLPQIGPPLGPRVGLRSPGSASPTRRIP